MVKDFAAIVVCILTACLVAIAASVEGIFLYGVPVVLLCGWVGEIGRAHV